MQNANLPPNLTIDQLIQYQVDHARRLGASEQEIASFIPFQKHMARMTGLEAFRAMTEIVIATDFSGAFASHSKTSYSQAQHGK